LRVEREANRADKAVRELRASKGDQITDLYCPHCLPPWEMLDVRIEQGEGWTCPGCRRLILMHTRKEPPTAATFAPWEHASPGPEGSRR
jgi:hypothetical protein